jgi:hypothetical protein
MAIELSLFNNSVTTLVNHLTSYYGEEAKLETYVICARVKSPKIPGVAASTGSLDPTDTSGPADFCRRC